MYVFLIHQLLVVQIIISKILKKSKGFQKRENFAEKRFGKYNFFLYTISL